MNRRTALALSTMTLLCLGIALPGSAAAQTAKDLVGTWTLVSNDTVRPDGTRVPTFGANPKGIIVFGSDGRFIYLLSRGDLPKFETNQPHRGNSRGEQSHRAGEYRDLRDVCGGGQRPQAQSRAQHVSELGKYRSDANAHGQRR